MLPVSERNHSGWYYRGMFLEKVIIRNAALNSVKEKGGGGRKLVPWWNKEGTEALRE